MMRRLGSDDHRESTGTPRSWWRLDLGQVVTIVSSMFGAAIVAACSWFALKADVADHGKQLDDLRPRVAAVEKVQTDTTNLVGKIETKLDERFDSVNRQLGDLKRTVDKIDSRMDARIGRGGTQ